MVETKHVYKRLTHKYNDGWKHEDSYRYLGSVVLGDSRCTHEPEDFDEGGVFVRLVELPAGLSRKQRAEWRAALAENLSKWGCRHEYDCCGCALTRTVVHATNHARRAIVVTSVSYNY